MALKASPRPLSPPLRFVTGQLDAKRGALRAHLRAKSLASLGCAPKRLCGGSLFTFFPPLRQKRLPLTGVAKHLKCQETTRRSRRGTPYTAFGLIGRRPLFYTWRPGYLKCFVQTAGWPPRVIPTRPPALQGALPFVENLSGCLGTHAAHKLFEGTKPI